MRTIGIICYNHFDYEEWMSITLGVNRRWPPRYRTNDTEYIKIWSVMDCRGYYLDELISTPAAVRKSDYYEVLWCARSGLKPKKIKFKFLK